MAMDEEVPKGEGHKGSVLKRKSTCCFPSKKAKAFQRRRRRRKRGRSLRIKVHSQNRIRNKQKIGL